MEKIILEFLNIYFYIFIITMILRSILIFTSNWKIEKINTLRTIIGWSLFILSIVLT